MRRSWMLATLAAGVLLVAGGCGGDGAPDGGGGGTTGPEQTCAATEQAMAELGADLQTALTEWDGTPDNGGDIAATADEWAGRFRELAADSSDEELRTLLEELATSVVEFGASWSAGSSAPDLAEVEAALAPLEDRCGFGAGAALGAPPDAPAGTGGTAEVCAAALAEADGGSFDRVATAAAEVDGALAADDQAALDDAVARLRDAAGQFAQGFRDLAAATEDDGLRAALAGIAAAVESWADGFTARAEPADLSGFQDSVAALGTHCD